MFINYKKLAIELLTKEDYHDLRDKIVDNISLQMIGIFKAGIHNFDIERWLKNENTYFTRDNNSLYNQIVDRISNRITDELYKAKKAEIMASFTVEDLQGEIVKGYKEKAAKEMENILGKNNEY